jgi:hypothetical protein
MQASSVGSGNPSDVYIDPAQVSTDTLQSLLQELVADEMFYSESIIRRFTLRLAKRAIESELARRVAKICPTCNNAGVLPRQQEYGDTSEPVLVVCPQCGGASNQAD